MTRIRWSSLRSRLEPLLGRRSPRAPGLGELAGLVHRLGVLLAAGLAPARAWRFAARGPFESIGARVWEAAERSGPAAIPEAIVDASRARDPTAAAWAGLAATWSVSASAGAPLAPTLRAYAETLRGFASAERDARIALAGPRATSRLVLVLPLVAVGFGALLGQDTIGVLVGSPIGWTCLAVGAGLGLAGAAWTRRLLHGAAAFEGLPGLVEELTAVAVSGGVSLARARDLVERALVGHDLDADRAGADAVLDLAAASGAPAGELLRAEADERRRSAVADARERAERLSVSLMLPLGVCVLPAFVAVGVVPLMLAVLGSTLEIV